MFSKPHQFQVWEFVFGEGKPALNPPCCHLYKKFKIAYLHAYFKIIVQLILKLNINCFEYVNNVKNDG